MNTFVLTLAIIACLALLCASWWCARNAEYAAQRAESAAIDAEDSARQAEAALQQIRQLYGE